MQEQKCSLADLVRFDQRNADGEPVGRVVQDDPRTGLLYDPPDKYVCRQTRRTCIACTTNCTTIADGRAYCSTEFDSSKAAACPWLNTTTILT